MRRTLTAGVVGLLLMAGFAVVSAQAAIRGDYVEVRSADIYAGRNDMILQGRPDNPAVILLNNSQDNLFTSPISNRQTRNKLQSRFYAINNRPKHPGVEHTTDEILVSLR